MELVTVEPGVGVQFPVFGDSAPDLVLDDEHTQLFKLFPQFLNVKAHKTVLNIHVGTVVENVKAACHIELQGGGDTGSLQLRLSLNFLIEIAEDRHIFRSGVSQIPAVHGGNGPVNNGLFNGLQSILAAHDQLA